MKQERFSRRAIARRNARRKKTAIVVLCVALLVSIVCGSTVAFVIARSRTVDNSFTAGRVACSVAQDYSVQNTGNTDAYIRATIVVNWENSDGDIRGIAPVAGQDYTVTLNEEWTVIEQNGRAYYYYNGAVAPNGVTAPLCTVSLKEGVQAPAGFTLAVEVPAEAIQAEGDTDEGSIAAVQDAWGVVYAEGAWAVVSGS